MSHRRILFLTLSTLSLFLTITWSSQANSLFGPAPRQTGFFYTYANHTNKSASRVIATNETYAMLQSTQTISSTDGTQTLQAGSLYPVADANTANSCALLVNSQVLQVPTSAVSILTVPTGSPSPVKTFGTKVVLAFDDSTSLQTMTHVQENISILSPLSFFVTSGRGTIQGSLSKSLINAAKLRGVQIWPIVESGFNPTRTTSLLQNPTAEFTLLKNIVQAVENNQLDGINLDFEDMIPSDRAPLTRLVTALAEVLHTMGKGLSVDVTPPSNDPNWGVVYDRAAIAQAANYEVVMTYDEHYQGDPIPGSTSSLPWMEQGIDNTLQLGVPASKILIGIPFYTLDWTYSNHAWQSQYLGMDQALSYLSAPNATVTWSTVVHQDILRYQTTQQHIVWLENATSLSERGAFVKQSGVAGVGIWQIGLSQPSDLASLMAPFH